MTERVQKNTIDLGFIGLNVSSGKYGKVVIYDGSARLNVGEDGFSDLFALGHRLNASGLLADHRDAGGDS